MMSLVNWIYDGVQLIGRSPLAKLNDKAIGPMVREAIRLKQYLASPVRIAVLGEVKAGKSTLVNALIGETVSPTDVLEATAVVQYLRHGPGEGIIVYSDGRREKATPADLFNLLEKHRGDVQFASSIERVELALPLSGLEAIEILDTPGLASMSESLSNKTLEEIARLDAVVWVFNAHHAGAQDVLESFERVARTGRPVIAVVNRVDELVGDVDLVLQEFEDRLDAWNVDVTLPTNAKGAMEGSDDGVKELRKRLEGFASAPDDTKLKSACAQIDVLLHSSAELHRARREAAEISKAKRETLNTRIVRAGQFVTDEVESKVRKYVFEELFNTEHLCLLDLAESAKSKGILSSVHVKKKEEISLLQAEVASMFESIGPRMQNEIQPALVNHIKIWMEDAWRREGRELQNLLLNAGASDENTAAHESALSTHLGDMAKTLGDLGSDPEWEPVLRETAVWGGAGTALAAYSAWLGANAAFISIGSALSAIVPPLLLAGVTVGVVKNIFDRQKEHRKRVAIVNDAFQELRKSVWDSLWVQFLRPVVSKLNMEHVEKLLSAEQLKDGSEGVVNPDALVVWADEAESFRRAVPLCSDYSRM